MQRRTLVMVVGDNWFLNRVCGVFERMSAKYCSEQQPAGVLSLFPETTAAEWQHAFQEPLTPNTELKIYLVGHGYRGSETLASIDQERKKRFRINVQVIAAHLHELFTQMAVVPSSACPVKISLVTCGGATSDPLFGNALAIRLLQALSAHGCNHLLVKAYEKKVLLPVIFKKLTNGHKVHFYLEDNTIYRIDKDKDVRKQILKVCKQNSLQAGIAQIATIKFSAEDYEQMLQEVISHLLNQEINLDSHAKKRLLQLSDQLNRDSGVGCKMMAIHTL